MDLVHKNGQRIKGSSNKKNVTNQTLFDYWTDIKNMNGTIYAEYHEVKNKQFMDLNGVRIRTILENRNRISMDHFQFTKDEAGKPSIVYDDKKQPVLKEGITKEMYQQALTDYMNEQNVYER